MLFLKTNHQFILQGLWQLFMPALFTRHSFLRALMPLVLILGFFFFLKGPYFRLNLIYAAFFFNYKVRIPTHLRDARGCKDAHPYFDTRHICGEIEI